MTILFFANPYMQLALDNIWIEQIWRSVKRENIYLREYQDGKNLFKGYSYTGQVRTHVHSDRVYCHLI